MSERLLFEPNTSEPAVQSAHYGSLNDGDVQTIVAPADKLDNAIVFLDIDGLFADLDHRLPYYDSKEWEKFYGCRMAADTIHLDYATVAPYLAGLKALYRKVEWLFLTGRPERTRELTVLWLKQNISFFKNYDVEHNMLMRDDNDIRVGFRVKWELMREWIDQTTESELRDTDVFFLDDDYRNIRYCYDKARDDCPPNKDFYLHGIVLGGGRLPSVHAIKSTDELRH